MSTKYAKKRKKTASAIERSSQHTPCGSFVRSVLRGGVRKVYKGGVDEGIRLILTLWARLPSCPVGAAGRVLAKHSGL